MRWVLCAVAVVMGLARPALAQDFDVLRGSESVGPAAFTNWSGFYAGGHAAYVSGGANFAQATGPLIAYVLRNTTVEDTFNISSWQVLGKSDATTTGFGGFAGYNSQWTNVILGVEANYTKAQWYGSSTDTLSRRMDSGGTTYNVAVTGTSSIKLNDYGSLRARAGYVMGRFMPYGFVGLAIGQADITKSAVVSDTEVSDSTGLVTGCLGTLPSCSQTNTDSRSQFIFGYSGGLGLDMALTQNVFVRAEYEYIQFTGLGGLDLYLNNVRLGGGFKF
jgi:outer membrane immunogenic protein